MLTKVSRSTVIYQPRTAVQWVHDGMVFILSIAIIHKYLLAISTHNTVLGTHVYDPVMAILNGVSGVNDKHSGI